MRLTLSIFLSCALGAAIWAQASTRNAAEAPGLRGRIAPADIQAGMRARLHALPDLALTDIVMGEQREGGNWSFRARAFDPAWPNDPALPVYGLMQSGCDVARQRADCWSVALLELDGAPRLIAEVAR